ncbi:hypothetical protein K380107A5_08290 [Holdemania massiliensis]
MQIKGFGGNKIVQPICEKNRNIKNEIETGYFFNKIEKMSRIIIIFRETGLKNWRNSFKHGFFQQFRK